MLRRSLVLLFATLLLLSSCMPRQDGAPSDTAYSFVDDLGRTVELTSRPSRVAALIGSFADVWMLAGGEVCATADDAWDDFALPLSAETVNLGATKSPSLEALLAASPDFVIASAATAKNVEWRPILEQANIPVAYFDVSNFLDYLRMLDICTDITGRKDLYAQNGTALQTQIDAIKTAFSAVEEKPTVLFLRASAGYIRAKNSHGSVLGEMLADLGCVNIADSDESLLENLSIENILREDPTHILIVQVGDDAEKVKNHIEEMMEENPAWLELEAVRSNRVHYLDKRLFNLKPNARWAQAYEILAQILCERTQD